MRPGRAKASGDKRYEFMLLPFQGVSHRCTIPRVLPWAMSFCPCRARRWTQRCGDTEVWRHGGVEIRRKMLCFRRYGEFFRTPWLCDSVFILNNYLCHVVGEMLMANGGYVKSLGFDEKSWGNIWRIEKYFVTLQREFSPCNPPRGMTWRIKRAICWQVILWGGRSYTR